MTPTTVRAPHDQSVVGELAVDDASSIDAKVSAALRAMDDWASRAPTYRTEVLLRIAEATQQESSPLAAALSLEQGKTLKEAYLELQRYVGQFRQYAGLATSVGGRRVALGGGIEGLVQREPVGVVAAVVPWNFPASLFGTKLAPALAAGCGFLVKPAETTSLITTRLAAIAASFLPEGLLDVVVGGPEAGAALIAHRDVARVAFTGSTGVGKQVARTAGEALKRVTVELGGCDPFLLCEDADLDQAVRGLMGTRFFNAGQVCVAPKRLVVHEAVAEEVVARLSDRLDRVRMGPGLRPESTMGPLHTEQARARIETQISDAADRGAKLIGGGRPEEEDLQAGWFLRPGLLLDPPAGARVRREETFGPVLTVIRFRTDEEAIALANETPFGLGASVWSGDQGRAMRLARQIQAGYTWVNALARVYDELPFGGVKESGFGREHGTEALESYLEDRSFVVGPPVPR